MAERDSNELARLTESALPSWREVGRWGVLKLKDGIESVRAYGISSRTIHATTVFFNDVTLSDESVERYRAWGVLEKIRTRPGTYDFITYLLPFDMPKTEGRPSEVWPFKAFTAGKRTRVTSTRNIMKIEDTLVEGLTIVDNRGELTLGYFLPEDQADLIEDIIVE